MQDKYNVSKAFLFLGYVPEYESLYTSLQKDGYILVFKPTLKLRSGKVKGNVDAEMVIQTMIEYDRYDKALIVTSDGDFHCLVKYLIEKEKLLKLMIPNKANYSSLPRKFSRYNVFMNDLRGKLQYKKKRGITYGRNPSACLSS